MDYSGCQVTGHYYAGTEKKIGVIVKGREWILKFQYRDELGIRFNHVSEYIGSHAFSICGFDAQETMLGTYKGEEVVACRNFIRPGHTFVPFNDVGQSSIESDRERYRYSYDDIMRMLIANRKLTGREEAIRFFWDMYVMDALLGNFDRHGGNWGFLKHGGRYTIAPVFDNGSCLFPRMTDEDAMRDVISSKELTDDRVFGSPTSQIELDGRKSSYYDVISSLRFPECNDALERMAARIDIGRICDLIDAIDCITGTHGEFYKHMLCARYEAMVERPLSEMRPCP